MRFFFTWLFIIDSKPCDFLTIFFLRACLGNSILNIYFSTSGNNWVLFICVPKEKEIQNVQVWPTAFERVPTSSKEATGTLAAALPDAKHGCSRIEARDPNGMPSNVKK
mmetsp:Transcript_30249/g.61622  ORF Transcript_30249/g.61622 Transcript_30249/m.61622 type:complete len:109 (-) Transcript_30249:663-989(-)